ncbi:MAG: hypothetical protein GF350_11150 [Chitinivibrionales bacterium]|nr:hypothetical protein [Chitinivibrionales bacterium]
MKSISAVFLAFSLSFSATFYVSPDGDDSNDGSEGSPFATFHAARDALRAAGGGGEAIVKGGNYFLTEPISLDERDNNTTWKGAGGEEAWIFGGQRITGWEPADGNIYRAKLELGPDISLDTMAWTLSENGKYSRHARFPDIHEGIRHGATMGTNATDRGVMDPLTYNPDDAPAGWQDDYHMRLTIGPNGWFSETWPVDNVDFAGHIIELDGRDWVRGSYSLTGSTDFIDLPGEWAIAEDGYLYYWPKHSPIQDQLIVVGTVLRIFDIKGSSETDLAENIVIEDLFLSTTDCTYRGISSKQSPDRLGDGSHYNCDHDYTRHGIVTLQNAINCTVRNCRMTNAGIMGVMIDKYAQDNTIESNWIEGINYHGVSLQGYCVHYGPWELINRGNIIQNNYIYRTSRLWSNGAGVYMHQSGENTIQHNEIREMVRYAITMKGGGPDVIGMSANACAKGEPDPDCVEKYVKTEGNEIKYNDISHVMHSSNDVGPIESWNCGINNAVFSNLLHDCYHITVDVRTWNRSGDPEVADISHSSGTSNRRVIYKDAGGGVEVRDNAGYNIIDVTQRSEAFALTRSALKRIVESKGWDWNQYGLRSTFKWYGTTPATASHQPDIQWYEEVVHDPEYIDEFIMNRYPGGTGLTGTYFSDGNFSNQNKVQVDSVVYFSWDASPAGSSQWSARWEGYVVPPASEKYRFFVISGSSMDPTLWIDGTQVLDPNTDKMDVNSVQGSSVRPSGILDLEANTYVPVKLELVAGSGSGFMGLQWWSQTEIPVGPVFEYHLFPSDHDVSRPPSAARNTPAGAVNSAAICALWSRGDISISVAHAPIESVKLMGLNGAVVARKRGGIGNSCTIDCRGYSSGMYFLQVKAGDKHLLKKIAVGR